MFFTFLILVFSTEILAAADKRYSGFRFRRFSLLENWNEKIFLRRHECCCERIL